MKLISRRLLLAVSFSLIFASCSGDQEVTYSSADFNKFIEKDFPGTWRYENIGLNGVENNEFIICSRQMRVTVKGDHTYTQRYEDGADCPPAFNGTWEFDAATNRLTLVSSKENTTTNLVSASTSKFALEINTEENKVDIEYVRIEEAK